MKADFFRNPVCQESIITNKKQKLLNDGNINNSSVDVSIAEFDCDHNDKGSNNFEKNG
jgi:hypothetical protein